MRRLIVGSLHPGQVLARAIYNERGDVLLNAGVEVTERFITLLQARGVSTVLVREPGEEDVLPEDIVSERVRVAALANVHKVFEVAAKATADVQGKSVGQIVSALQQPGTKKANLAEAAQYERLFRSVETIVDEVLVADTLPGLTSLKSYDNYTFCHSVDVAVTALLLGKKLFLTREQLKILGIGCILHDIGKSMVPLDVLNKPGKLTDEEFEKIKAHPTLGFELLNAQMPDDVLPKHVAFQHHERQDGSGYPRKLSGTNKVARDEKDKYEGGRMLLLAEIAAVADVYDALASDRPYRPGLPPEKIVAIMQDMRETHLNAEVLDTFFNVLPRYPVGVDLVVTDGPHFGFRGVVLSTNKRNMDRPLIRLSRDRSGARLSPPLDLDLTEHPEVHISCIVEEALVLA